MQGFHRDFKPGEDYTVEAVRFYRSSLNECCLDDMSANGTTHVMIKVVLDDGRRVFFAGKSKCGPRDNFSKKIGRAIAIGRAIKAASYIKKGLALPEELECPLIMFKSKE